MLEDQNNTGTELNNDIATDINDSIPEDNNNSVEKETNIENNENKKEIDELSKFGFTEEQLKYVSNLKKDVDNKEVVFNKWQKEIGDIRKREEVVQKLGEEITALKNEKSKFEDNFYEHKEEYETAYKNIVELENRRTLEMLELQKNELKREIPNYDNLKKSEGMIAVFKEDGIEENLIPQCIASIDYCTDKKLVSVLLKRAQTKQRVIDLEKKYESIKETPNLIAKKISMANNQSSNYSANGLYNDNHTEPNIITSGKGLFAGY